MSEPVEGAKGPVPGTLPIVIRCRENGPYVIQGEVKVVDHLGQELSLPTDKPLVALCRCGASGNKPFCDGSHKVIAFDASNQRPE
jgi:CDGSH-type Zn-finger protein